MFGHVAQRFLRDAEEDEGTLAVDDSIRGERRKTGVNVESAYPFAVFGKLGKRRDEATLLDDRGVQPMSDPAQHDAEVFELAAQGAGTRLFPVGNSAILGSRPLRHIVLKERDALERVVMHFASDVGALLLVGRQELLGILAMEGEEAPLVDEDRGA